MELEGVAARACCEAPLDREAERRESVGDFERESWSSVTDLFELSGLKEGSGGGHGDTEIEVTLAVCAW